MNLFLTLIFSLKSWSCTPPTTYIPLPPEVSGSYIRVHPQGRYILVSNCETKTIESRNKKTQATKYRSEQVTGACLLDMKDASSNQPPQLIRTIMNDEAYPLEPDWSIVASPNHKDGHEMQYFTMNELTQKNKDQQTPFHKDSFNEFYHSLARIAPDTMRVMSWSMLQYKDYTISSGAKPLLTGKSPQIACRNIFPTKFPFEEFITTRTQAYNIMNECTGSNKTDACYNDRRNHPDVQAYIQLQRQAGDVLENPVLNKTGSELGALHNGKLTVFKLETNGNCTISDQLPFRGSKMNFSYPKKGRKGKIAFTNEGIGKTGGSSGVFIHDRDNKKTYKIGNDSYMSSYPGFTEDDKLIYLSSSYSNPINRLAIVDLKNFDLAKCENNNEPGSAIQHTTEQ